MLRIEHDTLVNTNIRFFRFQPNRAFYEIFDDCGRSKPDIVSFPDKIRRKSVEEIIIGGPYIDKQIDYLVQIL